MEPVLAAALIPASSSWEEASRAMMSNQLGICIPMFSVTAWIGLEDPHLPYPLDGQSGRSERVGADVFDVGLLDHVHDGGPALARVPQAVEEDHRPRVAPCPRSSPAEGGRCGAGKKNKEPVAGVTAAGVAAEDADSDIVEKQPPMHCKAPLHNSCTAHSPQP